MKTIVGKVPTIPFRSFLYDEEMPAIMPITNGYFSSWHSHDCFGHKNEPYVVENAIYTYPKGTINLSVIGQINLSTSKETRRVFYDNEKLLLDRVDRHYNAIEIYVNQRIAGYYLPDINSLVLSDWTHGDTEIRVFMDIWPSLVEKLHLSVISVQEKVIQINEITVGCDPEFELLQDGEVINAEEEIAEEDGDNQIGTDGAGDQIEIRPEPGNPIQVTQNIRKLLKQFSEEFEEFKLGDCGNVYPLGGHIHVGLGFEYRAPTGLIELLNDFIGGPTLKLSGEARGDYMALSQVRRQPHGFEYRSTPAAVFHNPAIACIIMRLAKNLTKKYITGSIVVYNDNPSVEDYIHVGGLKKQQALYFMKFCRGGFKGSNDLVKEWKVITKIAEESMSYHPNVVFRDSWDREIRSVLRSNIGKIEISRPITVLLYGLSTKNHGSNKCTIPTIMSSMVISKPIWNQDKSVLQVGVSFNRRHVNSPFGESFTKSFGNSLVYAIQKHLQEV